MSRNPNDNSMDKDDSSYTSDDEYGDEQTIPLKTPIQIRNLIKTGEAFIDPVDPPEARFQKEDHFYYGEELLEHLNPEMSGNMMNESGSTEDEDDERLPFDRMADRMEDISGDGGVLKKMMRAGSGPIVPTGSIVTIHYNNYLEFGDEPFDSSRMRRCPQRFILNVRGIILGMDIAVSSMRKNERADFLLKPEYAYKELGCGGRVPPNSTILCTIEVLDYVDCGAAIDRNEVKDEVIKNYEFAKLIDAVVADQRVGNDAYARRKMTHAKGKYKSALDILNLIPTENADQEIAVKELYVKMYTNLAACYLNSGYFHRAIGFCEKALEMDKNCVKALFRFGEARFKLGEYSEAIEYYRKVLDLVFDQLALKRVKQCQNILEEQQKNEKAMCIQMFSKPLTIPESKAKKEEGNKNAAGQKINEMKMEELTDEMKGKIVAETFGISVDFMNCVKRKMEEFILDENEDELKFPNYYNDRQVGFIANLCKECDLKIMCDKKKMEGVKIVKPSNYYGIINRELSKPNYEKEIKNQMINLRV